jgi:hypothetical protein
MALTEPEFAGRNFAAGKRSKTKTSRVSHSGVSPSIAVQIQPLFEEGLAPCRTSTTMPQPFSALRY